MADLTFKVPLRGYGSVHVKPKMETGHIRHFVLENKSKSVMDNRTHLCL